MQDNNATQKLSRAEIGKLLSSRKRETRESAKDAIFQVHEALAEKGYNPVSQLTGYILSGDPTYITSYKDARKIITRLERDELLEELISFYLYEPDESDITDEPDDYDEPASKERG